MSDREPCRSSQRLRRQHRPAPADLPPPETRRWVARRKAQVVAAVRTGTLSLEEACRRYTLSAEEFAAWEQAIDRHGVLALRVTRLQEFRQG
jgi:transposase-like protein